MGYRADVKDCMDVCTVSYDTEEWLDNTTKDQAVQLLLF